MCLLAFLFSSLLSAGAQGTVPTFKYTAGTTTLVLAGRDPSQGGTLTIPTVVVPVTLSFEGKKVAGRQFQTNAGADVPRVLQSPVFSRYAFPNGGTTQYGDAMLRATFPDAANWHTLLGKPQVKPVAVKIPVGYGYVLTSRKTGRSLGMVDLEFLQREVFKQIPQQPGSLVIVLTHNTAYYPYGDATVCCSWGTHGVDTATGNSFVLASYLQGLPAVYPATLQDRDIQPLTEQLAELFNDPLRDPMAHAARGGASANVVPAWTRPMTNETGGRAACGGTGIAAAYVLMEPTDLNPRSELPVSKPFVATAGKVTWHLQNVALVPWYTGAAEGATRTYSFPDAKVLPSVAVPCPARGRGATPATSTAEPVPLSGTPNGHGLIGYWAGSGSARVRDASPQWDYILVAFAVPDPKAPEGTLVFRHGEASDAAQFKQDVAWLKSQGKKVMISLGGGGQFFKLDDPKSIPNFVNSVTDIVKEYGFDGIDLDFESPSLVLDPGDTDFKHPKTPSIVNLIAGLRQLHDRFGDAFLISLVPEGTQIPAGYTTYGGQFGTYLPLLWGIRDIVSFVDSQDYNTPPLQGLDGEIYQLGSVDYHSAMTELLLHGFNVGQDPNQYFPPLPANKVATGFLVGATTPDIVSGAMDAIITGKAPAGTTYRLRKPTGYPGMIGAMFWTINADRGDNLSFSNKIGPQLHSYPAAKDYAGKQ